MKQRHMVPGLVILLAVGFLFTPVWADERIEISTYVPAPGASGNPFDRLHAKRMTIGENPPLSFSLTNPDNATLTDGILLVNYKIGIGTADPVARLHIHSGTGQSSVVLSGISDSGETFSALYLDDATASPTKTNSWVIGHKNMTATPQENALDFTYWNNSSTSNSYMAIQPDGDVGIGTINPASTLDLNGSLGLKVTVIAGNTALDKTHNVVLCNNGANISVTLPAPATNLGRTYYIKKVSNNLASVTISPAGGLIDGAAALTLYVWKDAVRIISDGANWNVISDELRPHAAKIVRNVAQAIPHATLVKLLLDAVEFDVGGMADPVNSRIVIRRAGRYRVTASWVIAITSAGREMENRLMVNGAVRYFSRKPSTSTASTTQDIQSSDVFDLAAGDVVEVRVEQYTGSSKNTLVGVDTRPRLSVEEIRP